MTSDIGALEDRLRRLEDERDIARLISTERETLGHLSARLGTLGPAATLARGYAVVQTVPDDDQAAVLRAAADAPRGTRLRIRVSDGVVSAVSEGVADRTTGDRE